MEKMIFCVAMKKGGVGKTTLTINISQVLAICGYKVLVIDNDEQHNLSSSFHKTGKKIDMTDLYNNKITAKEFIKKGIYKVDNIDNLYISPCSPRIGNIEFSKAESNLREFLELADFDYIFIDCAPGSGLAQNKVALKVSEYFILPTQLKQFSFDGLKEIMQSLTNTYKKDIDHLCIVPNGVSMTATGDVRNKKHREFLRAIQLVFGENVTKAMIPLDETLDDVLIDNKSIFLNFFKTSKSSSYFLELIIELFGLDESEVYYKMLEARKVHQAKNLRKAHFRRKTMKG